MNTQAIMDQLMKPLRRPVAHDEGALRTRVARGDAAHQLRLDETFQSLLQEVEDFYLASWRSSTVEEVDVREKCHVAIKIVDDMRGLLISRERDGEVARETLKKAIKTTPK